MAAGGTISRCGCIPGLVVWLAARQLTASSILPCKFPGCTMLWLVLGNAMTTVLHLAAHKAKQAAGGTHVVGLLLLLQETIRALAQRDSNEDQAVVDMQIWCGAAAAHQARPGCWAGHGQVAAVLAVLLNRTIDLYVALR